jgi:hypothetical protein
MIIVALVFNNLRRYYDILGIVVAVVFLWDLFLTWIVIKNKISINNYYLIIQKENNIILSQIVKFGIIYLNAHTLIDGNMLQNKASFFACLYIGVVSLFFVDFLYSRKR